MSALAQAEGAINLAQGFPDFEIHEGLITSAHEATRLGLNQYAPMTGLPELKSAISNMLKRTRQITVCPETELTVTSGGTEALFCAISSLVQPGDEVLIFEPAYDSYKPVIELSGAKAVPIELAPPHFQIPWEEVKRNINQKTKAIILNSPHNPTGSILNSTDIQNLASLAESHSFWIISDEVYEHIVFGGAKHESPTQNELLRSRSFIISSFGKTFHATGWKVGYCLAPEALTREFRKIHQYVTFSTPGPFQYAFAKSLSEPKLYEGLKTFYQEKRDLLKRLLEDSPFQFLPCYGTYFQLLDYSRVSTKGDLDFCKWMTTTAKVAPIPISAFYSSGRDEKIVRLCFAKKKETLEEAAHRIKKHTS